MSNRLVRDCAACLIVLSSLAATGAQAQTVPDPSDTLQITASIPFDGQYGSGRAYVYTSDPLGDIANPVIAVEGFDLDNDMDWDELYLHLNQESMLETLRAEGFDIIVLDFTDATDYVQRNSFVLVELIEQVQSMVPPSRTLAVAGASMGGLCARYALAYMETNGIEHRVRTFISFDAPQEGADIPLGVQYWLEFFSGLSASASDMLAKLDRPAARQMLVYHHSSPPGSTGEPDPLRAGLLADLAAVGDYPQQTRKVAISNGSGYGAGQEFPPGEQVIEYEYEDILTTIRGNVWAVGDGTSQTIFDGYIRILVIPQSLSVTVSGTKPYDSAPGGWRSSMADMDSTEAPYGDIIALYDNHCFIPTVSALAIDTEDLYYDVAGDPDILSKTPFDAIYYPSANQEHVDITAENAQWFMDEIRSGVTGIPDHPAPEVPAVVLHQNYPNPFNPVTTITFDLSEPLPVKLAVYNVKGELVAALIDRVMPRGANRVVWDAVGGDGNRVASGVYFYRIRAGGQVSTRKMVLLR